MKPDVLIQGRERSEGICWPEVHRRLAVVSATLEQSFAPTADARAQILRRRAHDLARPPIGEPAPGDNLDLVEFRLAQERYAVESRWVGEVLPLKHLTELPCAPPFVAGIMTVRGRVVTVIDIRRFFDLPLTGLGDSSRVIVLRAEWMEVGVLADAVIGSRSMALHDMLRSLPTLTGIREEYLRGVAEGPLIILDAEKLLKDRSLVVNEEDGEGKL
jgi:purine-binding chemotaxis protein CheW